jgi:hypothetical protein
MGGRLGKIKQDQSKKENEYVLLLCENNFIIDE